MRAIEKDMTLLGAIGIEDELQNGVPEAIEICTMRVRMLMFFF